MAYFGDKRDTFERLHPTCTSFFDYHPAYPAGLVESTPHGVIFVIAWWSSPALQRFKFVCRALDESAKRPAFHVVNIDGIPAGSPIELPGPLYGCGEVFLVRAGKIAAYIDAMWPKERFDAALNAL